MSPLRNREFWVGWEVGEEDTGLQVSRKTRDSRHSIGGANSPIFVNFAPGQENGEDDVYGVDR
jgi:hypothetical protein